jgi:hypothetical protein
MRKSALTRCVAATAVGLIGQAAAADETKSTYVDVSAGAGYSSDPSLQSGSSRGSGSAFASLSGRLSHRWSSERTSTVIAGYWEGSEYFNYGLKNLLSLTVDTRHAINERLDVTGSAGASADFAGQLSSRFVDVAEPGPPLTGPVVTGPAPDVLFYSGSQYRADGTGGLTWQATPESQIFGTIGVGRVHFTQSGLLDHTSEYLSAGYLRSLSERTEAGIHIIASATQFDGSNDVSVIVTPAATLRTHIAQDWTLSGSAGMTFSKVRHAQVDRSSTAPSFSASLCHDTPAGRLCGTASHSVQSSGVAELISVTMAQLEWLENIDEKQTVQISAGYAHYANAQALAVSTVQPNQYHIAATYNRRLSDRFSIGGEAAARGLSGGGRRSQSEISASVFVRYRWGNIG